MLFVFVCIGCGISALPVDGRDESNVAVYMSV